MTWPSFAPSVGDVRFSGRVKIPVRPMRPLFSYHASTILPRRRTRKCPQKPGAERQSAPALKWSRPEGRPAAGSFREREPALAPSEREQREHLEADVGRDERCHARRIVRGRDLDAVEAAEVEAGERADVRQRLAARRPADLRRPGPGREGRVDEVDVEGEEAGSVLDAGADALREAARTERGELLVRERLEPELLGQLRIPRLRERAPQPRLQRAAGVDEPLLDGAADDAAVEEPLAEI